MKNTEYFAELLKSGLIAVADAITPLRSLPGKDSTGGYVSSLTEAVMGMTAGLTEIANAIADLAEAVRERNS